MGLGAWVGAGSLASAAPITLTEVGSGFSLPVFLEGAPEVPGRLFVGEKTGRIRILDDGRLLPDAFLDLTGVVATEGERGLLGLAFHPNYAENGAFYVFYPRAGDGTLVLERYLRMGLSPNAADPASGVTILTISHPETIHNGGQLAFGPDGLLYISTGDGGAVGDPFRNAQDPSRLLGKILRIAVDGGSGYEIPEGNPFAGSTCDALGCPEVLHWGLRNPWKFSFERGGGLIVADVGNSLAEEATYIPPGAAGLNLGWPIFEGTRCFDDEYFSPAGGACAGLSEHYAPQLNHDHAGSRRAIIGGFLYQGRQNPRLRGAYVYADFVAGEVYAAIPDPAGLGLGLTIESLAGPAPETQRISAMGRDAAGELYAAGLVSGRVFRIDQEGPGLPWPLDFTGDDRADVVWRNESAPGTAGELYLSPMDGTAVLPGEGVVPVGFGPDWQVVAAGDVDGDRIADLVWRNGVTGDNFVSLLNGTEVRPESGELMPVPDLGWQVIGSGDFDADGRLDLFWRYEPLGYSFVWLTDGLEMKPSSGVIATGVDMDWNLAAVGDFDGDGFSDLLWRNPALEESYIVLMNGAAIRAAEFVSVLPGAEWQVQGAGDLDGDGRDDVVWRSELTGEVSVSFMQGFGVKPTSGELEYGEGFSIEPVLAADPSWAIASVADFDGDGMADLLWHSAETAEAYLFSMRGRQLLLGGGPVPTPGPGWEVVSH